MSKRSDRMQVEEYSYSEGELEWASKNIPYLQSVLRGNCIQMMMLGITFAIGLVLYGLAQLMNSGVISASEVLADFLYNLGITLWTSVVLAFLLEVLVDRQRQYTQRYLSQVQEALRRQGKPVPESGPEAGVD